MAKAHRGGTKPKKKQARASSARVRRAVPESRTVPDSQAVPDSPRVIPVAMTPRPDLSVPSVSLENVDWEDGREPLSPLHLWEQSERHLEKALADLGATKEHPRLDLKEGRVVWLDGAAVPMADARAQVIATWLRGAGVNGVGTLLMAWADPVLSHVAVARLEEMADAIDVDQPTARELALHAADGTGAELVLGVEAPHGEHYLALRALRPAPGAAPVTPGSPVGLVLRGLADLRRSVTQRDEPTDVLRTRFLGLKKSILAQAEGAHRESEWAGRLQRAAKVLGHLAGRLVPPTFTAIAAGRPADEWLGQSVAVELIDALKLLEDEWGAFA
jgi:hypothetical protein